MPRDGDRLEPTGTFGRKSAQRGLDLRPVADVKSGQPGRRARAEPGRQARHVAEVDDVQGSAGG